MSSNAPFPVPNAPTQSTPSQNREPSASSFLEDAIQGAFKDTLVEQGTEEGTLLRGEDGRFIPREGDEPDAKDAPKGPKGEAEPEGAPAEKGKEGKEPASPKDDGTIVTLPVADPKTLATPFTLSDETGELDIPQGLIVSYTANGRERKEPLDKVVMMAKMGVYNHEREQRVMQTESRAQEIETYATSLETTVQEREQQMERLLRDPEYRERAIAEYEGLQTPEQQALRLERERQEFRDEQQRTGLAQSGTQYFTTQIVPSVEMLQKATPHVSAQEITDRLAPFVNRQKGPLGLVPQDRYDAISQHFVNEIVPWARSLDDHRAVERGTPSGKERLSEQTAQDKQKDAELSATQVRAQKARRIAAANLKPAGRGASPTQSKAKTPVTPSEIMDDVIASTKAAVGMA